MPISELTMGDLDQFLFRQFGFWNENGVDMERAPKTEKDTVDDSQKWVKVSSSAKNTSKDGVLSPNDAEDDDDDDEEEDLSDGQRR